VIRVRPTANVVLAPDTAALVLVAPALP
jgi:hypothetical protein